MFKNSINWSGLKVDFFGEKVEFDKDELDQIRRNLKEKNRISFLLGHLEIYQNFIKYKMNDGIAITKLIDNSEFITCDNPVIVRNSKYQHTNIFDPENMIHLTLNNKHLLEILPKKKRDLKRTFLRITGEGVFAALHNNDIEKHAERWVIGSKRSLTRHIKNQEKYCRETPENSNLEEQLKEKTRLYAEFITMMEKEGMSINVINRLKELKNNPLLNDDTNFKRDLEILREKGYEI